MPHPLLREDIDPIPRYRILKDLLQLPDTAPEMLSARREIRESTWCRQLLDNLKDPVPERLLREDSRVLPCGDRKGSVRGQIFQSVDDLVLRARQIGLTGKDPELKPLVDHLVHCVEGRLTIHESSCTAVGRMLAAGLLQQVLPSHPSVEPFAQALAQSVTQAAASGRFNMAVYVSALCELLDIPETRWVPPIETELLLVLLPGRLSPRVECILVDDLLTRPRGIIGITNHTLIHLPLQFPSAEAWRYVHALELLSNFSSAVDQLSFARRWLKACANSDGLWDLTLECRDGLTLPLSECWRKRSSRRIDASIQVLNVLKKLERNEQMQESMVRQLA